MIILSFGHRARHGKDGAAYAIADHCEKLMLPVLRMSWADELRRESNEWLSSIDADVFLRGEIDATVSTGTHLPAWVKPDPNAKPEPWLGLPYGKHPLLLQWWGTEYRRAEDPDYWVKLGKKKIESFGKKNPMGVVLIPDTRFQNEFDLVKSMGGHNIRLLRLNQDGSEFRTPDRDPNHISEVTLQNANWDFFITVKDGDSALKSELAVCLFEYIRALRY